MTSYTRLNSLFYTRIKGAGALPFLRIKPPQITADRKVFVELDPVKGQHALMKLHLQAVILTVHNAT